uniref:glycoside hydrolase family 3 protein n=1 Tax=Rathayibacter sp. VKM Ac-2630 TaxID=1938617 RepID=UPI001F27F8E2|nr:glycoside hydrolase family 3 N-terminal domain-containing protein [Rathayibacter sp. VKM Ac-2630]
MTVSSASPPTGSPVDRRYLDPLRPVKERVRILLGQMTLEEKAGLLFQTMIVLGESGALAGADEAFGLPSTSEMVLERRMTHFNLLGGTQASAREIAEWHNRLQELAASTRLGIPVTVSTDPRHSFTDNPGTGSSSAAFSQWPEPLGLGAIGDEGLVERFGDIARREYLAVGLRVALHPQIDLATESRWARQVGTFGEDADLTGRLGAAYIRGFQGAELGPESVATMTKHFPGGGPQKDGEDPHFAYGREQVYPGGNAEYHLRPFEKAFEAGTSQIMPYYGMPVGTEHEEVGFGFNRSVITGLLRERFGFDGVVCTDWGLLTDADILGDRHPARAWGVEHLTVPERMAKALDAGATSSAARRSRRCSSAWCATGWSRRSAWTSRCDGCCGRSSCWGSSTRARSTRSGRRRWSGRRSSARRARTPSGRPSRCSRTTTSCRCGAACGCTSRASPPRLPPDTARWWSRRERRSSP